MKTLNRAQQQLRIFAASAIATSAMTVYSYLLSWIKKFEFKEPRLLSLIAGKLDSDFKEHKRITGWSTHYLTGLLFAELYAPFWEKSRSVTSGLIFGGLSGVAAILIWKITLSVFREESLVNFPQFAGQLVIAHVVFGLFTALALRWMNQNRLDQPMIEDYD